MATRKSPRARKRSEGPKWKAFIRWHPEAVLMSAVETDKHDFLDFRGWFVVLGAEVPENTWIAPDESLEVLYIGDSYPRQHLRGALAQLKDERGEQLHRAASRGHRLIAILGRPTNKSRKLMTRDYLDGVLAALRRRHAPRVGAESPSVPYCGETVSVVNKGHHHPLKSRVLLRPDPVREIPPRTQAPGAPKTGHLVAKPGSVGSKTSGVVSKTTREPRLSAGRSPRRSTGNDDVRPPPQPVTSWPSRRTPAVSRFKIAPAGSSTAQASQRESKSKVVP